MIRRKSRPEEAEPRAIENGKVPGRAEFLPLIVRRCVEPGDFPWR